MTQTSIFQFSSLLELLSGQNYSVIPRQNKTLLEVFWPVCFNPIASFKPHLIWDAIIHQSSFITQEERLWLTTVSSASVTRLLI